MGIFEKMFNSKKVSALEEIQNKKSDLQNKQVEIQSKISKVSNVIELAKAEKLIDDSTSLTKKIEKLTSGVEKLKNELEQLDKQLQEVTTQENALLEDKENAYFLQLLEEDLTRFRDGYRRSLVEKHLGRYKDIHAEHTSYATPKNLLKYAGVEQGFFPVGHPIRDKWTDAKEKAKQEIDSEFKALTDKVIEFANKER